MSAKGEKAEKGDKPVKQLLFKANQPSSLALKQERAPKQPRRISSDSNESMDFGRLQEQIDMMCSGIVELREDLNLVVKKEEIEECVTWVMTGIEERIEERIAKDNQQLVERKVLKVTEKVESLEFKYQSLQEKVTQMEKIHSEQLVTIETLVSKNYDLAKEANRKANYNEEYSCKNNIKMMDVKVDGEENTDSHHNNMQSLQQTRGHPREAGHHGDTPNPGEDGEFKTSTRKVNEQLSKIESDEKVEGHEGGGSQNNRRRYQAECRADQQINITS